MHNLKSSTKITSLNSSLNCLKWSPLSFQCHKCSTRPRHIKKPAWGPRFINGGVRLHPYSVFWLWFPSSFCMTVGATPNQDKPNQARDKQQCTFSNWQERKMPKLIIVRVYLNCNICLGKAKIKTNKSTPPNSYQFIQRQTHEQQEFTIQSQCQIIHQEVTLYDIPKG